MPEDRREQVRVVCELQPRALLITERRPAPDGRGPSEEMVVARLRYVASTGEWLLDCVLSSGRFRRYDPLPPQRSVTPLLAQVEADPTGIFWG